MVKLGEDSNNTYEAIILRRDNDMDSALLKIDSRKESWPVVPLGDSTRMRPGDSLTGLGFGGGNLALVPTNPLTSLNTLIHGTKKTVVANSLAAQLWQQWRTIFDNSGTVVGVAVAINEDAQNVTYVVPIQYLSTLIGNTGAQVRQVWAVRGWRQRREAWFA